MIAAIASLALMLCPGASPAPGLGDDPPKTAAQPKDDPLAEARGATDREEWGDAAEKFRAFLKDHPDAPQAPEARFWVGFCLVKLGENEKAVEVLNPFRDKLAEDKWADDALLQIGKALHGLGKEEEALSAWKRHLEKYTQSVWRNEVSLAIIDLLFHHTNDLVACLAYCRLLTEEVHDRGSTTEARYLGAYCLNALRKFDESEAWADRHFDPERPLEEAWRRVLGAQRDLLRGRVESALGAVDSAAADFPDLDQDGRQDLLLKTTYILRFNGRADRAQELLEAELVNSSGRPQGEVDSLLDELDATYGKDRHADFLAALGRLVGDRKAAIVVRVTARDRQAQGLKDDEHVDQAEALLRAALASEKAEFPRFRAALKLAEVLADDAAKRDDAMKVLDGLRTDLKRRDLIHQLRDASARYRRQQAEEPKK
jgi:predicted negative regulator of RcsB-dependent stress response